MSNIAVVDVETNGLNAGTCFLLEVAVIPVNNSWEILDEDGFHAIVAYSQLKVDYIKRRTNEYVTQMHETSGLWDKLTSQHAEPLEQINMRLAAYLSNFGPKRSMSVGGNSVRLDMNFLDAHLPLAAAQLDYHMRDVSSLAGFFNDWVNEPYVVKAKIHEAMADVRECIAEAQHYRDLIINL